MPTTPAGLPDSIEELRALVLLQKQDIASQAATYQAQVAERDATINAHTEEISELREYIRLLKSAHFGPSSERTAPDQLGLFNEAEVLSEAAEGEADGACVDVPGHTRRKRGGRRPLPDYLPREEIVHDLSEEEKVCPHHPDHLLVRIGEDKLEQLAFVPSTAKVLVEYYKSQNHA